MHSSYIHKLHTKIHIGYLTKNKKRKFIYAVVHFRNIT